MQLPGSGLGPGLGLGLNVAGGHQPNKHFLMLKRPKI